jgi:adenylate cyclase
VPEAYTFTLKGEGLSEARHNLRTPINHILGYGEMLMEDAEDQGKTQLLSALRQILDDGKAALAIINAALTPATNEVAEPELFALRDALLVPVNLILERIRHCDPDCSSADADKIRTAAERLLTMATEIVSPNGSVSHAPAVVPAFQSAAAPLSGAAPAPETKPWPEHEPEKPRPGPQAHLLVVDDNETNRDVLSRRLEREGYRISCAENGRQALEMVRETSFDLVLLDIMMPEIDGYQVLSRMKADPALHDIPVIMISALDEIRSVVRCIEMGAEDYLNKPFDPVLLRARVGATIEKKRLRDEQQRKTREIERAMEEAETRRRESESLLRNILPAQIAAHPFPREGLLRMRAPWPGEYQGRQGPRHVLRQGHSAQADRRPHAADTPCLRPPLSNLFPEKPAGLSDIPVEARKSERDWATDGHGWTRISTNLFHCLFRVCLDCDCFASEDVKFRTRRLLA